MTLYLNKKMRKREHLTLSDAQVPPKKSRANRKRRNWHPLIRRVCALALLAELGVLLFANPHLRVTHVQINGLQTLPAPQVFAEARVPVRRNIFLMALREPFARRLSADPVIDHVRRSIRLPNTLVLTVTERQPYAVLAEGGTYWLLDDKGIPFRSAAALPPSLPVLSLEDASSATPILGKPLRTESLKNAYALLTLLRDKQNLSPKEIKVDQNANICLNRTDDLPIQLGQAEALPRKVALAQVAVTADGGEIARRAAYIDVSCPDQPVWKAREENVTRSDGTN